MGSVNHNTSYDSIIKLTAKPFCKMCPKNKIKPDITLLSIHTSTENFWKEGSNLPITTFLSVYISTENCSKNVSTSL